MLLCVLILVSFVTTPALTRVASNEISCRFKGGFGSLEEFKCQDGTDCVGMEKICDGVRDCTDGSDEAFCSSPLSSMQPDLGLHRRKRQAGNCNTPRVVRHHVEYCSYIWAGAPKYQLHSVDSKQRRAVRIIHDPNLTDSVDFESTQRRSEWQCRDGNCISFDGKCDGVVDCPDRSDETQALCRNMPCQTNWFRCTYGACVDGTAPCNGIVECADSSDELLPRCKNETTEVKGRFKCREGTWIDAADLCDGTPNCPDGSDETVASCADKSCPSYLFQCAYGACVDQGSDCNGKVDCADGSDESEDLCNRILTPVTKPVPVAPSVPTQQGHCVLPPYPDHGTYEVANVPNARPGQSSQSYVLTVMCNRGYGMLEAEGDVEGNGTLQVYCVNGQWFTNMPKCVRFCHLTPDPSVRYSCLVTGTSGFRPCKNYVAPGSSVKPVCNSPNYYSPDGVGYMKCIGGSFDKLVVCKPECGRITPDGLQLVAGGKYAKRGEVPWHVGIYTKTTKPFMQICGGSLVTTTLVISAAHCFWRDVPKKLPASNFAVAAGKLYRPWNDKVDVDAQKTDVKDIHIPSLFQGAAANFQEDIAVVIVVTPFIYMTYIRPVCVNYDPDFERQQLQPGNYGKVAGWGLTGPNGAASPILKVVDLPFIDVDTCIRTLPPSFREYITGDKICAGYTNGTAVCQGDSGGGLAFPATELNVERYYLRGIVSTAPSNDNMCNADTYTTFTKITKHEGFIRENS